MTDNNKLQGNAEGLIERMKMGASVPLRHHSKSFRAGCWRPSFSNLVEILKNRLHLLDNFTANA